MQMLRTRGGQFALAVGGVVVLALLIWLILWISLNGLWPLARDIALIVLALVTMVPLLALAYAVLELVRTAQAIRRELVPMFSEVKETTQTVGETAKAATDFTIKPAVRTASFLVGFGQAATIILGRGETRRSAERRRRTREAAAQAATTMEGADG